MEDETVLRRQMAAQMAAQHPTRKKWVTPTDKMLGIGKTQEPAGQGATDLKPGDQVEHKVFGKGMVLSVTPMGNDHLVEAAFENVGTKKIMAKFARLKKL